MWKQLYGWAKWLLSLALEEQKNRSKIKDLEGQIRNLTAAMQRMAYEISATKRTKHMKERSCS